MGRRTEPCEGPPRPGRGGLRWGRCPVCTEREDARRGGKQRPQGSQRGKE